MNTARLLKDILFWLPLPVIAVLNGFFRESVIVDFVDSFTAHQISTFTFLIIFIVYCLIIKRKMRINSRKEAFVCGIVWFLLTIVFESIMSLWIMKMSFRAIIAEYNLLEGKLWSLIVVSTFVIPYILFTPGNKNYWKSKLTR